MPTTAIEINTQVVHTLSPTERLLIEDVGDLGIGNLSDRKLN